MARIEDSRHLLTTGGVETYLVFIQQARLREFCGFDVYDQPEHLAQLQERMLTPSADAALATGHDLLIDALTWRAHTDFVRALGFEDAAVERINDMAVRQTREFVARWRATNPGAERIAVFINGDIGPRGDGYRYDGGLTVETALAYHRRQVEALAEAGADVINALTMTNVAETVAIAKAAQDVGLPCIVSPTVETDGTTPEGLSLGRFIEEVDRATGGSPMFHMVNCAHPHHLEPTLRRAQARSEPWLSRFRGFRANASRKSHAELDESTELDRGRPDELAAQMAALQAAFDLRLVGGCCGTDAEHITCIAEAVAPTASVPVQRTASPTG